MPQDTQDPLFRTVWALSKGTWGVLKDPEASEQDFFDDTFWTSLDWVPLRFRASGLRVWVYSLG